MRKTFALAAAAALVACGGSTGGSRTYPDPGEPADDVQATANALAPGTPVVATVASPSDWDFYAFPVPAGGATVRFQTFDEGGVGCAGIDTFLELYDASGRRIAWSDDSGTGGCEDFTFSLPEGTGWVAVSGYVSPAVYTLKVTIP